MGARLYIGNLSWDTTEDSLHAALFEGRRGLKDLHMVMDRETGRPRGLAFAEMANEAEARAAIDALNGTHLEGRPLTVIEARERQPRSGCGAAAGVGRKRRLLVVADPDAASRFRWSGRLESASLA